MSINVEAIIREYIDKTLHMSLATVRGDKPWICEVHFVYDDDLNLYFRSLKTTRHSEEIALNPNVAGNIVRQHELGEYPGAIYFEGMAEMLDDSQIFSKLYGYFKCRQNIDESVIDGDRREDGHKFYKITVETWYAFGKFEGDKGMKYKLAWNGGQA